MGRYRKIDVNIHNDAKFRSLSDQAKLLWYSLLTHPNLTSMGAMRATQAGLAEEMGWDLKRFQEPFRELLSKGMVCHDQNAPFLCIPNFLKYNRPDNQNVIKSWAKYQDLFPECRTKNEYFQQVLLFLEGLGKPFAEPFLKLCREGYAESENREQGTENTPPIVPPRGDGGAEVIDAGDSQAGAPSSQEDSGGPDTPPAGKNSGYPEDFEDFWKAYPAHRRTGGKEKAYRSWQRWKKAGKLPPVAELLKILEQLKHSEDWQKEGGRFIPMITTWLNAGRWTDVQSQIYPPTESPQADPQCPHCSGQGIVIVEEEGRSYGKPCSCRGGQKVGKE
ncbi:MAG: hypothetical protein ACUVXF_10480 [Desulfobaccales bacterium]